MSESFAERVERLRASVEATKPAPPPVHDDDVIPEIESTYERTDTDDEIDRLVDSIDILEAYAIWCGKMQPKVGGRTESIMISCPKPGHRDATPSAWINTDKQTWFCGSCNEGGDKLDIAAYHFGLPVPGYKDGKNYPELLRRIAESRGFVVRRTPGGTTYIEQMESVEPAPEPTAPPAAPPAYADPTPLADRMSGLRERLRAAPVPEPEPEPSAVPEPPLATVLPMDPGPTPEDIEYPAVEWRDILPPDSFMRRWMDAMSKDDIPDEFYFWTGLQAVGLAAGRETVLADSPVVNGNLFVCLFGQSGDGKSRSIKPLVDLLREALPYDHDDEYSTGAHLVPNPGSAETLIDSFSKPVTDPADPKKIAFYASVRGLVRIDELSTLTGRSARTGSVMKPTIMEFYDCYHRVEIKSRSAGLASAEKPFAAMLTTTQPKAIRDIVTQGDADSGFLTRWIFASGLPKKRRAFGGSHLNYRRCVDPLREIRSWSSSHAEVTLSAEAEDIWDAFFHSTVHPDMQNDDTGLLTRGDLHLKKLMLLFALDRHEAVISGSTMQDVTAMWKYIKASYAMLGGQIGMGPYEDARKTIVEVISSYAKRNSGASISRRELGRWCNRRHIPIDILSKLIPMMISLDQIEEGVIPAKRGPSKVVYRVAE